MKYVYKVEPIKVGAIGFLNDSGKQAKQLGESGEDGWELVCISEGKKYLKYVYCKAVSDEEYEAEVAKAKVEKPKKSKVELTPEQIKKRNSFWTILVGAFALITAVLAMLLAVSIVPESVNVRNEFYIMKYGHESSEIGLSPGYYIGLAVLIVGIVIGALAFVFKKTPLWIVALACIVVALVFMLLTLYVASNNIRFYTEEIERFLAQSTP
jgi:multisubunit Na+/H+ antiporter MnhB subunit